ncbi:flavoprotein [Carbonactinospora thermoautotrophica]|uniref:Phosphopantothenoylcysteine decarboxylase n=1 Tax=Carbonactinospora thermoautotrophica TaxID=1469144 RepID=A0A132MWA2_9ACTN|nr:flavoprotein [Carbonactinospora thermoautotrophica]KWX02113.1 Phosphopantothenoylcysteine decarboxylase [Carbonactinospora thermoautotrophica]MCX9190024.1 flavoprotein [Carbonactinospora thermoautotrophica]
MSARDQRPVLYVVACGGPPAADVPEFASRMLDKGWRVCVLATPSALRWLDTARLEKLTGYPVRSEYRQPGEVSGYPSADAIAVAPATFNTVNKWAVGISDTYALGVLQEALAWGRPIIVVPWVNAALGSHPLFLPNLDVLRSWGVRVIHDAASMPKPGTGPSSARFFPWAALQEELSRLHDSR